MGKNLKLSPRFRKAVELGLMLYWGLWLQNSPGNHIPYLLTFAGGLVCWSRNPEPEGRNTAGVFAWILALCVSFGNVSRILWPWPNLLPLAVTRLLTGVLLTLGGVVLFRAILLKLIALPGKPGPCRKKEKRDLIWLFGPWVLLAVCWSAVLYLAFYPGVLSIDNISQMEEILGRKPFSNRNPYYHTRLIGLFYSLGSRLVGNPNGGVALYSQFSVIVMSGCLAYGIYTLYQCSGKKWPPALRTLPYQVMPAHVMYGITMWNDVLFSGAVMVFALSLFRYEKRMGSLSVVCLSALAMCLLRVNGAANLAVVFLGAVFLCRKDEKRLLAGLLAGLVAGFVLVFPVLSALGIGQSDPVEALSIPIQQIGFVVQSDCPLSGEEQALLEQLVDLEDVKEGYMPFISDPMKYLIRQKGNISYLSEHKWEYLKLYVKLGLRHPLLYLQAWSEQTKGYLDGGYDYDRWNVKIDQNELDLYMAPLSRRANAWANRYLELWEESPVTKITLCLGFQFWIILGAMGLAAAKKDRALVLFCLPFVSVVALLAVGTPVFAEFRYAYSLVMAAPFVVTLVLFGRNTEKTEESSGEISGFPIAKPGNACYNTPESK